MKILIVGSKGFIGEHLKKHFDLLGYDVWGADIIIDYVESQRYFLIDASNPNFNLLFNLERYDICINCSGAASVPDSLQNPLSDFSLNTTNVFKLLESIRIHQPSCKFINLSSAAIYGNPNSLPVREENLPNPLSPYGVHKLLSEQICREYYDIYKISTCSLRIFSAFGEGLKKQLFWDLNNKVKSGKPISLFGDGKESRDFIYITDLIQAIEKVAINGKFNGETLNVANGLEISIAEAVSAFYCLFDYEIEYKFSGKRREGDPNNWVADISKLTELGYKQHYDLKSGLNNYFIWLRSIDKK